MAGVEFPKEKLREDMENYPIWSLCVMNYLKYKKLWAAVKDSDEETAGQALAVMNLSIAQSLMASFATEEDPKKLWEGLKLRYFKNVERHRDKLDEQFKGLKQQSGESIATYFARGRALQVDLQLITEEENKADYNLSRLTSRLVRGLSAEFDSARAFINGRLHFSEGAKTELDYDQVLRYLLVEEEKLLDKRDSTEPQVALVAHTDKRCWNCGNVGHLAANCPN